MNPSKSVQQECMTVTVVVNGTPHQVERGSSVAALLAQIGRSPESVAVAVDAVFVPRALRDGHVLQGGEQITCFQPIVGG
jgi:sulfur carrier protein